MRHERFDMPAVARVRLVKDCQYGKAGMEGEFSGERAASLIKDGYAEYAKAETRTENKAVQSEPIKRGPGRPRKIAVDDKAIA